MSPLPEWKRRRLLRLGLPLPEEDSLGPSQPAAEAIATRAALDEIERVMENGDPEKPDPREREEAARYYLHSEEW